MMPRHVRNFWLDLSVDGKRSRVSTGPVRKDGGFTLNILMRDGGSIVKALTVTGEAVSGDGPGEYRLRLYSCPQLGESAVEPYSLDGTQSVRITTVR